MLLSYAPYLTLKQKLRAVKEKKTSKAQPCPQAGARNLEARQKDRDNVNNSILEYSCNIRWA